MINQKPLRGKSPKRPRLTPPAKPREFPLVPDLGKMLVVAGLALAALGAVLWLGRGFRLPGDIFVSRGNFSFGFPVVTCLVISIVLTILLNLFRR